MEGIFLEYENENELRQYPFAAECARGEGELSIPTGLFVDAMLYPVNPSGSLYLSGVLEGVFSISDDTGPIMSGTASGSSVELYDTTGLHRHVGVLVASSAEALADFAAMGGERRYSRFQTEFASSCVVPVVIDGVVTMDVAGSGTVTGAAYFSNPGNGVVRACGGVGSDGRDVLRFDVLSKMVKTVGSIRRIICVVDGKTPFRIVKLEDGGNTVAVMLEGIDKEVVCAGAHRENDYEMTDTCECDKRTTEQGDLPDTYQLEEVYIPPTSGNPYGADNAFYLVAPNMAGYSNPVSITLQDGMVVPDVDGPSVNVDGWSATVSEGELADKVSSKGVVIQVPGLSGGEI
jgi:hypothetical protein